MNRKNRKFRLINGVERKEYRAWLSMRSRCLYQAHKSYKDYGGRGVKICDRWLEDFDCFFIDMGEKPTHLHTLDRIDTNGNYCPENCRWVTQSVQCNNRRSNTWIEVDGVRLTKTQWAKKLGVSKNNLLWDKRRTPEEMIRHYQTKGVRKMCFYEKDGLKMSTLEWAKELNTNRKNLDTRIRKLGFENSYNYFKNKK